MTRVKQADQLDRLIDGRGPWQWMMGLSIVLVVTRMSVIHISVFDKSIPSQRRSHTEMYQIGEAHQIIHQGPKE